MLNLVIIVVFLMLCALLVRYLRGRADEQPASGAVPEPPVIEEPLWTALDDHQLDRLLKESS